MSNLLKMANVESILLLHAQGWSQRRIARELGIDRETVRKYLWQQLCGAKPANAPTGSEPPKPANVPMVPAPGPESANLPIGGIPGAEPSKPAIAPTGSALPAGPRSKCEPFREVILAKMQEGLTAQRIYQDLGGAEAGLGYDSVRRFMRRLGGKRSLPFRRTECAAGEEAQVDFGTGARIGTPESRWRKTHVFRIVLSHSRKAYSEACYTQTTEDFLRCLENAFAHFGGVPQSLVIDNLKAAVAHPDWFDPQLTPKVQSFCQHYGTVILPTKPYLPRHKGKVESGIKYVKNNALKGRTFASLQEQNQHLAHWECTVADTRIHGTTKQQVGKLFAEVERAALKPLPPDRFPCFQEAQRKVNRDGHLEVAKAYYSVPPEYLGATVWVRWDTRLVRIFNHRWEQIAVHARHEKGRFSTQGEHLHPHKISGLERGAAYLLARVQWVGPQTSQWAQAMLHARGIAGTRVLQGLLSLTRKHDSRALERACETALSYGVFQLRTLRQLLKHQADLQQPLPFLEEHPIIRPLDDYAQVVAAALERQAPGESVAGSTHDSHGEVRFRRHAWTKESVGVAAARNSTPQQQGPAGEIHQQGPADFLPPRSGYPSSGCSPAEPDSVSPDDSIVVPPSPFFQEPAHE